FRDHAPALSSVAAWFTIDASVTSGGQAERIEANLVSGNYFDTLGAGAAMGRLIVPDDARAAGGNPVAVITYRFWQQHFGGERNVLNRQIVVNGRSLTVVGVAARGFDGAAVGQTPVVFVPITMYPQLAPGVNYLTNRRAAWVAMMGRLKPGLSRAA